MAIPPTPIYQRNILTFDNLAHHIELGRRLIIVRHAERVDRCFQKTVPDWVHRLYDKQTGAYTRFNLNMPRRCPLRGTKEDDNYMDYKSDCALTTIGEGTAERLGSRILGSNLKITKVYCSPALRCMQTCNRVLQGFCEANTNGPSAVANWRLAADTKGQQFAMNIEPAIYDFTGFAESAIMLPELLSIDFMIGRHMYINKSYQPAKVFDKLTPGEEIKDFYVRMQVAIDKILKDTENDTHASVLIVTHGPVMDGICQLLLRQPERSESMFPKVANYPPYVTCMILEENIAPKSSLKWRLAPPPIKSFTLNANPGFEWKKMCEKK